MAQQEGDFKKGQYFGSIETLELIEQVIENPAGALLKSVPI
ncbi:MAG: hypothetical protein Q8O62_14160 [Aequorivita sp.]|nr:hypothetical protein [Aequorivita sp.]